MHSLLITAISYHFEAWMYLIHNASACPSQSSFPTYFQDTWNTYTEEKLLLGNCDILIDTLKSNLGFQ